MISKSYFLSAIVRLVIFSSQYCFLALDAQHFRKFHRIQPFESGKILCNLNGFHPFFKEPWLLNFSKNRIRLDADRCVILHLNVPIFPNQLGPM